jgi:4-hydroxy-tetrahydrodipicolinate reductase
MAASSSSSSSDVSIMMNGLPGAMGREIAAAALRRGVRLAPFALTGPGFGGEVCVDDARGGAPVAVRLYEPAERAALAARAAAEFPRPGSLVAVDFTHPSAVNENAAWYAAQRLPFVMGTTGGDRAALLRDAAAAGAYAVVAPNMCKQIVALQAALAQMAADFPGSFAGYALRVVESHQSTKADTSGTAKAVSDSLAALCGAPFAHDSIERVREPAAQLAGGGAAHEGVSPVPAAALDGHAFHTYSLKADGVEFQIRHNVSGRATYAEGTIDAVRFLASRVAAGSEQRLFSMIDVLKAGGLS